MKFFHNIYLAFLILFLSVIIFCFTLFHYSLGKVSNNDELKTIEIEPGGINQISTTLYENHLIKNKFAFKVYVYLTRKNNLKAATYSLSENMGTKKIVDILYEGAGQNSNQISITFKEGLNMRAIAKVIVENTNHTEQEVLSKLKDTNYLNTLIDEYWFITEEILDSDIYYPLEGYLYPSTYYIASKNVTIEEIFQIMLDETKKQLADYEESIKNNKMSYHEIVTLASIVELEGVTLDDRKGIASVFFNRLDSNMTLGSDVTTYYGAKVDMSERDLYAGEVKECNAYNTRCSTFKGLPVSPICNPSIESINAVINPIESDYYYFVSDKNRKIYFSKNITEHNKTINKLKYNDLWYEY